MKRRAWVVLSLMLFSTSLVVAREPAGEWLAKVSDSDRTRTNPLASDGSSIAAGAQLYDQHCASCHGDDARGIGRRPSLRTSRVQGASDGELQWLLRNGSLRAGMPAWASLPEVQRWQLVRYLHSLPVEDKR